VSLSKLAYVGDRYVSLLPAAPSGDSLVGGTAANGLGTWNAALPEPAGDAGTAAFVVRSPDSASVVALSGHGLYAVDAASGRVLWQSQNTESFRTASDVGAPQLADTNVYVYDQTGTWWAVDLPSGRTRWRYPAVAGFAEGAEPAWLAVPGGMVVSAGGMLTMLPANG
jgi:outer membrane protein assembly factor BamB